MSKKLIVIVVDGLTPAVLEDAVERRLTPAFSFLVENGSYGRALSTFPSLTPVCLSSIATGAHPDVHHIPHLVWYHRGEGRLVEYGSSFAALRAAGTRRSIRDAIFNMSEAHLAPDAETVFERVEDAGLTAAAVNFTCYRGRTPHLPTVPGLGRPAYGPKRFFYYGLFESDVTGAPLAVLARASGSVDGYAAAVGRWLVTRDGFDFLLYYLPDYDFASHLAGPDSTRAALLRSEAAVAALLDAAGDWDSFLDRYAVVLCADHGQTAVKGAARLQDAYADFRLLRRGWSGAELAVTASNRAGMVYRLAGCAEDSRALAERLDEVPVAGVALFLENGEAVARREGEELRFAPEPGGWRTAGDPDVLPYPAALERAWAALRNPNAGDVIVSAADGVEFTDLAGRHHAGGGSHGSLTTGDSEVPMLTIGVGPRPDSITEIAPLALAHFGLEPQAAATAHVRAV